MSYRLSLSAVTGAEPVSLVEAKDHLRVDQPDEDALIGALTTAAREFFEDETGRQLAAATYVLTLDRFPYNRYDPIELPRPPLRSVTSIVYRDSSGAEQTWPVAEYVVKAQDGPMAQPGRVFPAADHTWPSTQSVPGAVSITYEAGYADGAVPESLRASLLLILGDLYANREAQVVGTIVSENKTLRRLVNRYRVPVLA